MRRCENAKNVVNVFHGQCFFFPPPPVCCRTFSRSLYEADEEWGVYEPFEVIAGRESGYAVTKSGLEAGRVRHLSRQFRGPSAELDSSLDSAARPQIEFSANNFPTRFPGRQAIHQKGERDFIPEAAANICAACVRLQGKWVRYNSFSRRLEYLYPTCFASHRHPNTSAKTRSQGF